MESKTQTLDNSSNSGSRAIDLPYVRAPLTTAVTIQKLLFETPVAAYFQERLQFKKIFLLLLKASITFKKPLKKLSKVILDHYNHFLWLIFKIGYYTKISF